MIIKFTVHSENSRYFSGIRGFWGLPPRQISHVHVLHLSYNIVSLDVRKVFGMDAKLYRVAIAYFKPITVELVLRGYPLF